MGKTIFNIILDAILKNLDISANSIGLKSEFRSRKIPTLSDLTKAIGDLSKEAEKSIINPNNYVQMCEKLFNVIQIERKKYHFEMAANENAIDIDPSMYAKEIERSVYEDLEYDIKILKEVKLELTKERVIHTLSYILSDAYYLAKINNNLVRQLAYNDISMPQDVVGSVKSEGNPTDIKYQKILNFENIGRQVVLVNEMPTMHNDFLDVTMFALHFKTGVEEGMSVASIKDVWENEEKRDEILSNFIDKDFIVAKNSYNDFKTEYLKTINLKVTGSVDISKLLGLSLASNEDEYQQYIDLIPPYFLLDKESLLDAIKKIRALPENKWIDAFYELLVPIDLLFKREKLIREIFEKIVFQFNDDDKLDYFLSTMCLNIQQSQDNNSIEAMITLMNVAVFYDLSKKHEAEKYLVKKKLGIWSPFIAYSETFEADCIDCINSISQEVDNRAEAIEIAKRILKFHKITNNERGVEICSESIIQLYMANDEDYLAMKREFWDNSNGELTELLTQLDSVNKELKKAKEK